MMSTVNLNDISNAAHELGDKLSGQSIKGGHATVYFGQKYVYKLTERKVMEKSSRIHAILSSAGNSVLTTFVPKTILHKDLDDCSLVVEERKKGSHPHEIHAELLVEINGVLNLVHQISISQVVTNFEGDELPVADYWDIQLNQARLFEQKLIQSDLLRQGDKELIQNCVRVVEQVSTKQHKPPKLVTVYKDVHSHNILVDDTGKLSAIVDWDSAMSGPVELEYAVLWHRYPQMFPLIRPASLDKDTFVVAGLVQGLRFWKSFTHDSKYSDQQREALRVTIELYSNGDSNWLADI